MKQSKEERISKQRARREQRIKDGLCPECGRVPAEGTLLCVFHQKRQQERFKAWNDKSRSLHLCRSCGDPVEEGKRYCDVHRERAAKRKQTPVQQLRLKSYQWRYNAGKGRFGIAKKEAARRGREWSISQEDYVRLMSLPCEYCGGDLPVSGIGLDRMDSSKGYINENVVSCCHECNHAKRDWFSFEEMKKILGPAIRAVRFSRKGFIPSEQEMTDIHIYGDCAVPA